MKGKEKGAVPRPQEQGIGAFASKYRPQPVEGEDDNGLTCFGAASAEVDEHVEGRQNEPATINVLALTSLKFETGLVRNISAEFYYVLIMLTTGRAQRLVIKAAEPGLEAHRLLFRRCEPISTVTTFSKLVELLATTFSGDLMDSLTDCERRQT